MNTFKLLRVLLASPYLLITGGVGGPLKPSESVGRLSARDSDARRRNAEPDDGFDPTTQDRDARADEESSRSESESTRASETRDESTSSTSTVDDDQVREYYGLSGDVDTDSEFFQARREYLSNLSPEAREQAVEYRRQRREGMSSADDEPVSTETSTEPRPGQYPDRGHEGEDPLIRAERLAMDGPGIKVGETIKREERPEVDVAAFENFVQAGLGGRPVDSMADRIAEGLAAQRPGTSAAEARAAAAKALEVPTDLSRFSLEEGPQDFSDPRQAVEQSSTLLARLRAKQADRTEQLTGAEQAMLKELEAGGGRRAAQRLAEAELSEPTPEEHEEPADPSRFSLDVEVEDLPDPRQGVGSALLERLRSKQSDRTEQHSGAEQALLETLEAGGGRRAAQRLAEAGAYPDRGEEGEDPRIAAERLALQQSPRADRPELEDIGTADEQVELSPTALTEDVRGKDSYTKPFIGNRGEEGGDSRIAAQRLAEAELSEPTPEEHIEARRQAYLAGKISGKEVLADVQGYFEQQREGGTDPGAATEEIAARVGPDVITVENAATTDTTTTTDSQTQPQSPESRAATDNIVSLLTTDTKRVFGEDRNIDQLLNFDTSIHGWQDQEKFVNRLIAEANQADLSQVPEELRPQLEEYMDKLATSQEQIAGIASEIRGYRSEQASLDRQYAPQIAANEFVSQLEDPAEKARARELINEQGLAAGAQAYIDDVNARVERARNIASNELVDDSGAYTGGGEDTQARKQVAADHRQAQADYEKALADYERAKNIAENRLVDDTGAYMGGGEDTQARDQVAADYRAAEAEYQKQLAEYEAAVAAQEDSEQQTPAAAATTESGIALEDDFGREQGDVQQQQHRYDSYLAGEAEKEAEGGSAGIDLEREYQVRQGEVAQQQVRDHFANLEVERETAREMEGASAGIDLEEERDVREGEVQQAQARYDLWVAGETAREIEAKDPGIDLEEEYRGRVGDAFNKAARDVRDERREAEIRAAQDVLERQIAPTPDAARLAELSAARSDFVIYNHDGRDYLVPKAVVDDFEFQKQAHAEESAEIQALKDQTSFRTQAQRHRARTATIPDAPTLNIDSAVDVTGLNADERFATTRALEQHLTQKAEFAENIGKAYEAGYNQSSVNKRGGHLGDARKTFDAEFRLQLSEAENQQLDAYLQAQQKQRTETDVSSIKTVASFIPGVGQYLAEKDAVNPSGPGGVFRTEGEQRQVAFELGFTALDVLPVGAAVGAAARGARTATRLVSPTEISAFGRSIPTGGGYVPGIWGSPKTMRVPASADNALQQQYNVNLALAQGREAVIDVGGMKYSVQPSPVQKALARENPDQIIMTHAGDAGFFEPGRIAPRLRASENAKFADDVENRTFFAPEPPVQFMKQSAFGAKPSKPGVVVVPTDLSKGNQLVIPSVKQGPTDANIMRLYEKDAGLLGHRITPDPKEIDQLLELGASRQQAYEMASRPHLTGAFDRPGKRWQGAYEVEDTLPTPVGASEFVGTLPELRPGPFIEDGGRIYAPESFQFETYGQRFRTNVGALRDQIKDVLTKPKTVRDAETGGFQRYQGRDGDDLLDTDTTLDPRLRAADPDTVGTAQLVSSELPELTGSQKRLVDLGRKSSDELSSSRYRNDPVAQDILRRRAEYDEALRAERAGEVADDLADSTDTAAARPLSDQTTIRDGDDMVTTADTSVTRDGDDVLATRDPDALASVTPSNNQVDDLLRQADEAELAGDIGRAQQLRGQADEIWGREVSDVDPSISRAEIERRLLLDVRRAPGDLPAGRVAAAAAARREDLLRRANELELAGDFTRAEELRREAEGAEAAVRTRVGNVDRAGDYSGTGTRPTPRDGDDVITPTDRSTPRDGDDTYTPTNQPTFRDGDDDFTRPDRPPERDGRDPFAPPDRPTLRDGDIAKPPGRPPGRDGDDTFAPPDRPTLRDGDDVFTPPDRPPVRDNGDTPAPPDRPPATGGDDITDPPSDRPPTTGGDDITDPPPDRPPTTGGGGGDITDPPPDRPPTTRTDITGRPPEDPPTTTGRRPRLPDESERPEADPTPTPQPPGTYPRTIAHRERIRFAYDPETEQYSATVVETSQPVITGWDESPPTREERAVGVFNVTPYPDRVEPQNVGRATIPDRIKAELKQQAESEGGSVSTTRDLRLVHDLDTQDTETRISEGRAAKWRRAAMSVHSRGSVSSTAITNGGELSPKYKNLLKQLNAQSRSAGKTNRRGGSRSRGASSQAESYQLPQIVISLDGPGRANL